MIFSLALAALILLGGFSSEAQGQLDRVESLDADNSSLVVDVNSCPALDDYFGVASSLGKSGSALDWASLRDILVSFMSDCLNSSEYFALVGAAQLNGEDNAAAIESLERALLLRPENGAALVDYAQALYNAGQLFPALEINDRLLSREDLPAQLTAALQTRDVAWRRQRARHGGRIDLLGGYSNNLNGASDINQLTLTLSGEPVSLALSDGFQSTSGPYTGLSATSRYNVFRPDYRHNWTNEVRGRASGDKGSDLLQFDSNYSFIMPKRAQSWQVSAGVTHLLFGGSPIFTGAQMRGRYQFNRAGSCDPLIELGVQQQHFKYQPALDGLESKIGGGVICEMGGGNTPSSFGAELGLIHNKSKRIDRPGADREGWQFTGVWRGVALGGSLQVQISHISLDDSATYSPILASGAGRFVRRNQVTVQHRRPLRLRRISADLIVNFFHQEQNSNIDIFGSRATTVEIGLGFGF